MKICVILDDTESTLQLIQLLTLHTAYQDGGRYYPLPGEFCEPAYFCKSVSRYGGCSA
jgi:hypothetical protein